MGVGQTKFKTRKAAQRKKRKGERVVEYKGGFQIRRPRSRGGG